MSLDFAPEQFQQLLQQASDILLTWYAHIGKGKTYPNASPEEIQAVFDEALPMTSQNPADLLQTIAHKVFQYSNKNIYPHYYGYITGGGNQAAILAEMLRNGLNQNNLKWHSAPANTEIEKIVLRWIAEMVGYSSDAGGVLTSGGAFANFLALAVARKIKSPINIAEEGLYACPPMTIYVSEEGHSSVDKAVDMLGLGKKYLRKIPVNQDFEIDTNALEKQIVADKQAGLLPICVVGIVGTTNTGASDDLEALANLCEKYDLWFHIDAAYGGFVAALESYKYQFKGMEKADSMIINPHKWLYVPFESACVYVKNRNHLKQTYSLIPSYLQLDIGNDSRTDLMEYNLQLTKDFKALKIWMTLKTYGVKQLTEAIEQDILKAKYLASKIEESADFELLAPVPMSIVCFRYVGNKEKKKEDIVFYNHLNQQILREIEKDGRVFLAGTQIKGKTALRVCCINHRRTYEDIDYLFEVLREIGQKVAIHA
ncbi:pyridoxal phosphate-dependent decarboxylase family protein [Thermoflexibacter ruber]|uniref:Glutamate or tyrosine decarboxylase n=1 Tax=Thermoflexibacter ruber TaxID=1003 RepID=A0A1I2A5Q5_9BACT|nr:aminotransferase class I/II-fold pyridoxal phosphate-dependent enzyme [Thermoflexibacter ruber]SFE38898.1 Glutamate or tyrosine decarboxylase [Thermoflexibacter ruber]